MFTIGLHHTIAVSSFVKYSRLNTKMELIEQFHRMLLEKEANEDKWNAEISKMEYHHEIRKNSEAFKADKVNIVGYLHGPCKLKERFSEDLIQQACGILEVNAFEAKSAKGNKVRCIYTNSCVFAHSCVPNTTHSILCSKDFK